MRPWRLRAATKADAGALVALEAASFGPASWGGRAVADGLGERFVEAVVAEDDRGAPGGFVMWRRLGDEAEILTLAVAPAHRRRGCARALLDGLVAAARGEGVRALFLEVDAGNAAAIALYGGAGFARIARRARYYKSGADALVMRLDL